MQTLKLKIREITEGCAPKKISIGDAIDLIAAEDYYIEKGYSAKIRLGIAIEVPEEFCTLMLPRSSTFKNYQVLQTNSVGLIDNSYCGNNDELSMPVFATETCVIKKGERICQIMCIPRYHYEIELVDKLDNQDRGGFGTTGKDKYEK